MISDEDMRAAWDRIARTADGRTIYLHLQRRLMGVFGPGDDSTLREDNGERRFAAKLIALMSKGIEQSASGNAAAVFTFAAAGPRAVSERRGAGRRVNANTYVPGYSPDPDEPPRS